MNFCKKNDNALFFSSINEIPNTIWNVLNCAENKYFSKDFLASIEKNHSKINFIYVVLVDDKKQPKAFASIQIVDFFKSYLLFFLHASYILFSRCITAFLMLFFRRPYHFLTRPQLVKSSIKPYLEKEERSESLRSNY